MGEERWLCRVLLGKPEGRRPLGRPRCRWVDNIRMDLQEVGCGYMDWIGLAQDRDRWRTLVSAVMNLRVPWNAGNFLTSCKPVSFSRRNLHHGVRKLALMTTLHPSLPSIPISPICWHECYWELFTAHTLLYINPIFGWPAFFLASWHFKIRPLGCHKKSVRNYHYSLCKYPGERSSHLPHSRSLKSCTGRIIIWTQQNLVPLITMLDLINNEQNRLSI